MTESVSMRLYLASLLFPSLMPIFAGALHTAFSILTLHADFWEI